MNKYIIIVLLFLSGCQPQSTIHIKIDSSFNYYQIPAIQKAAQLWKNKTNLNIIISTNDLTNIQPIQSNTIFIYNANLEPKKSKFEELTRNRETPVATTTIYKEIFIPNSVPARTNIFKIVIHELGHAFGCYHVNIPSDVMFPYLSRDYQTISKECIYLVKNTF